MTFHARLKKLEEAAARRGLAVEPLELPALVERLVTAGRALRRLGVVLPPEQWDLDYGLLMRILRTVQGYGRRSAGEFGEHRYCGRSREEHVRLWRKAAAEAGFAVGDLPPECREAPGYTWQAPARTERELGPSPRERHLLAEEARGRGRTVDADRIEMDAPTTTAAPSSIVAGLRTLGR